MEESQLVEKKYENLKHKVILLLNLKNVSLNSDPILERKYELIEKGPDKKEIINKLEKDSIELYYKTEEQKNKELESVFKQIKLSIKFRGEPKLLKEGIIYTPFGYFFTYNKKCFKKLFDIQIPEEYNIIHAIQLINKDLIIIIDLISEVELDYKILIYRLKDEKYCLLQTIEENNDGFPDKYALIGHCGNSIHLVGYDIKFMKEISENRFIIVSNYGFKLYSLNKNNQYSLVLLDDNLQNIEFIYELNENKFIFGVTQKVKRVLIDVYSKIIFKMVELQKITESEIYDKIRKKEEEDEKGFKKYESIYFGYPGVKNNNKEKLEKAIKIISSLKLSCDFNHIQDTDMAVFPNLIDNIILKNKYLIFMLDNNITIFDLIEQKLIKKYKIFIDAENHIIIYKKMKLKKWSNKEDNEFILIISGNVILFELEEEKNELKLKILNQTYFPIDETNEKFFKVIGKLTDDENKFYIYDKKVKTNVVVFGEDRIEKIMFNIY